jgi:hypothetical protein
MTTWEYDLRVLAQQEAVEGSFIGRFLGNILFYDAPAEHPAFLFSYVAFALLVVATFVFLPPRTEGYRSSTIVAIVLALVGTILGLLVVPAWIGVMLSGVGHLCWILSLREGREGMAVAPERDPSPKSDSNVSMTSSLRLRTPLLLMGHSLAGGVAALILTILLLRMTGAIWPWAIGIGLYLGAYAAIAGAIIGLFVGISRSNRDHSEADAS